MDGYVQYTAIYTTIISTAAEKEKKKEKEKKSKESTPAASEYMFFAIFYILIN